MAKRLVAAKPTPRHEGILEDTVFDLREKKWIGSI